jgi:hypothetical protein
MGVKISELVSGENLPLNNALLETSEYNGASYESKSYTRTGLTKRFYFSIDVDLPATALTSANVTIDANTLRSMTDYENIVADAGPSYDPFSIVQYFGTLEIAAAAYEKSAGAFQPRQGSSLSEVILSANGTPPKVKTYTGGLVPAVDNFIRNMPDAVTYSVSGTDAVFPIVAGINYGPSFGNSLVITFNLLWDEYTATPAPIKIAGYIDCNLIPQLLYSPA